MGQLYMQKFENWGAVSKTEFDQTWGVALQTFATTGNWGGVPKGVRHIKTYGTSWGGYVLIDVDDAAAFSRYQTDHYQTYGSRRPRDVRAAHGRDVRPGARGHPREGE